MLFTSYPFIILLFITLIIYYHNKAKKFQVEVLVTSSLIFYAYDQPILVFLLLFSAFVNIVSSYYIVKTIPKFKKIIAISGVISNLAILFFFKYSNLIASIFFDSDSEVIKFLVNIPLPIGISFFTFQGISLIIDVFKNDKNIVDKILPISFFEHAKKVLFFKSFFPQLISGPIVKAHDFYPQIKYKTFENVNLTSCFKQLVMGYFLKMVVADNLKDYTYWLLYPYFENYSSTTLLWLIFGYSMQIFADFAGYSLIALGLSQLFGYRLIQNFDFPYISTSFKEFWKRWHISLSTFLMKYLYIPLGGSKNGNTKTYLNLLITMILGGLWHGAQWSYAIWGLAHGAVLVLERMTSNLLPTFKLGKVGKIIKGISVFIYITLAWLLFKLPNFNDVIKFFNTLIINFYLPNNDNLIVSILIYSMPIIIYHLSYLAIINNILKNKIRFIEPFIYAILLFLIFTNSGSQGSFIYFQF